MFSRLPRRLFVYNIFFRYAILLLIIIPELRDTKRLYLRIYILHLTVVGELNAKGFAHEIYNRLNQIQKSSVLG